MMHPTRRRGALAELLVAYRFTEVGRLVSWPMVPCSYDLVVDGGDRLYRVQVKQAARIDERGSGKHFKAAHWAVRLTKRNQQTGQIDTPREASAIDILCVVATPAEIYVIPTAACCSPVDARFLNARLQIGPESRYRLFLNRFGIGTGLSHEVAPAPIVPLRLADREAAQHLMKQRRYGVRKRHRRLTPEEIAQIRQLPIRWRKAQPPDGLIPLEEIARQFDVCPATLRNVVFYENRLDLKREVSAEAKH